MPPSIQGAQALAYSSRCIQQNQHTVLSGSRLLFRGLSSTPVRAAQAEAAKQDDVERRPGEAPGARPLDDLKYAYTHSAERRLRREQGQRPIGSKRFRVARVTHSGFDIEQMPYQCYQEARKILAEERNKTLKLIETQRARLSRVEAQSVDVSGGAAQKQKRIKSMNDYIEELKIQADINDPMVHKRFEDDEGDMDKSIYRHLADKKWREMKRKIVMQRLEQMNVIPDVVPKLDPTYSVDFSFPGLKVQPGEYVESIRSQYPPNLKVQVYDAGPRLVTVVIVDSDVPNIETDKFEHRCHGIFTNITISPTDGNIFLGQEEKRTEILPWYPPYALKGSPYHRLSIFVLEHSDNKQIDANTIKSWVKKDSFNMRSFMDKANLKQLKGATMFRTQWDEGTQGLIQKYNLPGGDIQLQRKKPEKLPYKKKDPKRYR